jgi:hypothetical protein
MIGGFRLRLGGGVALRLRSSRLSVCAPLFPLADRRPKLDITRHALSFILVIANAQVFLKVFPTVRQILLGLGREHGKQPPKSSLAYCVKITQTDPQKLVHSQHDKEPIRLIGERSTEWPPPHTLPF